MEKQQPTFEEPEIVGPGGPSKSGNQTDRERLEDVLRDFAGEGADQVKSKLFWTAFWPLFGAFFVALIILGLFISLLFWLLPFAVAAFIGALLFLGIVSAANKARGLFKK